MHPYFTLWIGLKNVLQIRLFIIHISKPITTSNWLDYVNEAIEVVSNRDNIVFYSKNQLPVFADNRYNKLVITGGYSTGKSFLLKQKALLLSEDPEYQGRVMYICRFKHSEEGSLFYRALKHELEPKGIIVQTTTAYVSPFEYLVRASGFDFLRAYYI